MVVKPKRYSAWLALQNLRALAKFSGMKRLGLVLVAFGLPVSDEWLAAAGSHVTRKNPSGIRD
jgi:hypothetical protein